MACCSEEVQPVKLGVGAFLLDDEHIDTKPEKIMELRGGQVTASYDEGFAVIGSGGSLAFHEGRLVGSRQDIVRLR